MWFVRFPPIYAVAIAVVAGDGLVNFHIFFPMWMGAALALLAFALFLFDQRGAGVAVALIAIVAAGTMPMRRTFAPPADRTRISDLPAGTMVAMEGRLIREPERFPDKTRLYVETDRISAAADAWAPARGIVRVTVLHPGAFRIGDQVRWQGRLRFPRNFGDPGEFDYQSAMAREGIAATMLAAKAPGANIPIQVIAHHRMFPATAIESVRIHIASFIDRNLDDPVAAEMRALIIGDRGGIEEPMRQVFARTGMAHLLVISGLHLSMVAAAVFAMVRLLVLLVPALAIRGWANKSAAIAAVLAVCAYASIAGHHVSTSRALIMVIAYMIAVVIDRPREAIASLALASIVICIALPGSSADIGFELSFASVLAIVLGMRRYARWIERRHSERNFAGVTPTHGEVAREWALGYIAVSFWAMVGVAPLTAYYFNQFSTVGLVANAAVVPVMGFGGTVIGLAAAAMSFIWMTPAVAMLWVAGKFIAAGNMLAYWFADWPMAWARMFTPTPIEIALAYAALLLWLLWPMRWRRSLRWRYAAAAAVAAGVLIDAGWWTYQRFDNPDLRVTFLSVGEGDAAVVRFPGSRVMVIDGGGAGYGFDMGERLVARFLWSQKIMRVDWLALSHPDQDHFGGLDFVARNFSPRQFWNVASFNRDASYERLLATLYELKIPIATIDSTTAPMRIGGVTLAALNPPTGEKTTRNDSSMVLRLDYGATSFLFTGDLEAGGENAVMASARSLRSTVLKVPHHGSRTSSTAGFVDAVRPAVAVISLGYRNRFRFPAAEVMERYYNEGARVYRTDLDGAVEVDAGPHGATVHSYRVASPMRLQQK